MVVVAAVRSIGLVLALAGCGRIGFDGGDGGTQIDSIHTSDGTPSTVDAPPLLQPITCATTRTAIPSAANGSHLVVEAVTDPLVAWATPAGQAYAARVSSSNDVSMITPILSGMVVDRVVGVHPIATGHAIVVEAEGLELLYSFDAALSTATLRGMGRAGVGRSSLTGFGTYVMWGHVPTGQANALLFERLDANGAPTPQSNRITATEVRDVVVGGATPSHAHVAWAEASDRCTTSELFGGVPDLQDVRVIPDCRSPRNASGIDDSIVTAYSTAAGALRLYALSAAYEHDVELSPDGRSPALADDGDVVWATWFDGRPGGGLVLAKLEPSSAAVLGRSRSPPD